MVEKVSHPSFPEYFIRSDGFVERAVDGKKNSKSGDVLRGHILSSGYRHFKLNHQSGKQISIRANRLICEAFNGPAPSDKHVAAHKNGKRLDNYPNNLYWATCRENKRDSFVHGTAVFGETVVNQNGPAKITREIVMNIHAEYCGERGEIVEFARRYNVNRTCISKIINGVTWRHVPGRSALDQRRAGVS